MLQKLLRGALNAVLVSLLTGRVISVSSVDFGREERLLGVGLALGVG